MDVNKVAAAVLASLLLAGCGQSSASESAADRPAGDQVPANSTAADDGAGDCGIAYESRPAPGVESTPDASTYVGKPLDDARVQATTAGHEVRVIGEDGRCFVRIQDLRRDRVNVYVVNGTVEAAGHF